MQRSKSEFDWINNNLQDIIGQESNWILSKCLCRTCRHLAWLKKSRRPRQGQWTRQKALHPSSFHCCHLQDLFHVLVVSVLIVLCVLQCAPGWDLLCQRKSVERESCRSRGDIAVSPLNALSLHTFTVSYCLLGECESLKIMTNVLRSWWSADYGVRRCKSSMKEMKRDKKYVLKLWNECWCTK